MNIIRLEMRRGMKSLITWTVSLVGLAFLFLMIYPSLAAQMTDFLQIMKSFPLAFREAFGMTNFENGSVLGFYSFVLIYVLLAGSIYAMNIGVSSLSMEVRDKTADFLYSKPFSRCRIISSKIITILLQLLIINIVFMISGWLILTSIQRTTSGSGRVDIRLYLLMTASLAILQMFFASLGLFISSFLKRIRTVLPISMGVVFFFYTLYILNQTLDSAELAYISPFSYFDLSKIIQTGAYEIRYLITAFVLIALFIAATYRSYMKKDLPSI